MTYSNSHKQITAVLHSAFSFHKKGSHAEAKKGYLKVLELDKDNSDAYNLLGALAHQEKDFHRAIDYISKAIFLNPKIAGYYLNLGLVYQDIGDFDKALDHFNKALAIRSDYAEAYNNIGNIFVILEKYEDALLYFDSAIAINNNYSKAYYNRGNALLELYKFDEAIKCYDNAILLNPNYSEAFNNKANALKQIGSIHNAIICYEKALDLSPNNVLLLINHGHILKDIGKLNEAFSSYTKGFKIDPEYEFLFGYYLESKVNLCDWSSFAEILKTYKNSIENYKRISTPFPPLHLLDFPEFHKIVAELNTQYKYPQKYTSFSFKKTTNKKIRVGYFSCDFYNHATSYLIAELFELHNKSEFEIFGFSYGPDTHDAMHTRIKSALFEFIDVRYMNDNDISKLSRDLQIDIAIDLKGYTKNGRLGIFSNGCAPIQISYLGYPGTTGANYMHYVIADYFLIPECTQSAFTEKIIYLPNSYQVNDRNRKVSTRIFTKVEVGLPDQGFIFCCFNNNFKILPEIFDIWMRILKSVDGSVLWLLKDNEISARNLMNEAEIRGISSNRIIFAERIHLEDHLARLKLADLLLDTFPYNAHTTASDALWVGLPVLTCSGKSFASRVAGSVLNAIQVPELITYSLKEYENKAIDIANNMHLHKYLIQKIELNKFSTPLFDTLSFVTDLEMAYQKVYNNYISDLVPNNIHIKKKPTTCKSGGF